MYRDYVHGIADVKVDENLDAGAVANWSLLGDTESFTDGRHIRETRTSLTYRDVLKVSNLGAKLNLLKR
jgi:alkylated DNA repair protein alkB family protein 6